MAQSGSAPASGAGGREFESRYPDHSSLVQVYVVLASAQEPARENKKWPADEESGLQNILRGLLQFPLKLRFGLEGVQLIADLSAPAGVFWLLGKGAQCLCRRIGGKAACLQEPPLPLPQPRIAGGRGKPPLQDCQGTLAFILTGIIGKCGFQAGGCGLRIDSPGCKFAQDARPPPFFGPGTGEALGKAQIRLQPF